MCYSDGVLRARLDGELNEAESAEVAAHIKQCARCSKRASEIEARAALVGAVFSGLGAASAEAPDAAAALGRFERRRAAAEPVAESLLRRWFSRPFSPAWGAVAATAVIVFTGFTAPGRAVAQRLLGMLRVNAVVAVPIESRQIYANKGQMIQQVLADSVQTTKESRRLAAANREEAGRLAGYDVRLPEMRPDTPQLAVHTEYAAQFSASRQRLATLLSVTGRTDLTLPANLDGAKVFVNVPPAVEARYGDCPNDKNWREAPPPNVANCLVVSEAPSPTVVTLPELNLGEVAEFGLQLAGMTAEQAHAFSKTVNWESTLAVPIPRDVANYENVAVNGAQGILVTRLANGNAKYPPGYALIWAKNGMVYSLAGFGNSGMAVPLAESMR